MDAVRAMAQEAGVLEPGMMVTDCVVLFRAERVSGNAVRARFHPMGAMDDLRERGLIEQHHDDVVDEDRLRR
jgi:hypothetical protein